MLGTESSKDEQDLDCAVEEQLLEEAGLGMCNYNPMYSVP